MTLKVPCGSVEMIINGRIPTVTITEYEYN